MARGEDPQAKRNARRRAESVADLCKWYLEEYVPAKNPCEEVKPDPERRMERFLSAQERKRLEEELVKASTIKQQKKGHIAPGAADAIGFLGPTGMRSGEVVETLCWHHVD